MSPPLEPDSLLEDTVPQNIDQGQVATQAKPEPAGLNGSSSLPTCEDSESLLESSSEATAASGSTQHGSPPQPSTATTSTKSDDSGGEDGSSSDGGSKGKAGESVSLISQGDEVRVI